MSQKAFATVAQNAPSMELSMSALSQYAKCKKAFEYKYVRGYTPLKEATEVMDIGTLFHAGLAGAYANFDPGDIRWLTAARGTATHTRRNGFDYHGEMRAIDVSDAQEQLVLDMINFYYENCGKDDTFKVLDVEQAIPLKLPGGREIRCTFDLIVDEQPNAIVVYDHKTVGSLAESLAFLPLDMQANVYSVAAWKHFGFPVEFVHNYVARKVPKLLTATGRPSTTSKDPADYLMRVRSKKSPHELQYIYEEICDLVAEMDERVWYPREPQKGYTGCNGCTYRDLCSSEQTGRVIPENMIKLSYKIAPQSEATT